MVHANIPGYQRAARRGLELEDLFRESYFAPLLAKICGVQISPISLRMMVELSLARSPFISGGRIGLGDVAVFLWRLSPEYRPCDAAARTRFFEQIAPHVKFRRAVRGIRRLLKCAFMDKPPGRGASNYISDLSFPAAIIHQVAGAYGWERDQILDLSLGELFQYLRQIQRDRSRSRGEDLPTFHPLRTRLTKRIIDRARAKKQNEIQRENRPR